MKEEYYIIIKIPVTGKLANTFIDKSCEKHKLLIIIIDRKKTSSRAKTGDGVMEKNRENDTLRCYW